MAGPLLSWKPEGNLTSSEQPRDISVMSVITTLVARPALFTTCFLDHVRTTPVIQVIFFFLKFLEDMSPFCGATDTPVSDFW